jgi:hypothetical protein
MCNDGKLGVTPRLSMVAATCADATELASRRKARPARVAVLMILTPSSSIIADPGKPDSSAGRRRGLLYAANKKAGRDFHPRPAKAVAG